MLDLADGQFSATTAARIYARRQSKKRAARTGGQNQVIQSADCGMFPRRCGKARNAACLRQRFIAIQAPAASVFPPHHRYTCCIVCLINRMTYVTATQVALT